MLTRPTSQEHLKAFYQRIRPGGPGWKPIAALSPLISPPDSLKKNGWGWAMGVFMILGATIAIGKGLLGYWNHAIIAGTFAMVGLFEVCRVISKMRWRNEA